VQQTSQLRAPSMDNGVQLAFLAFHDASTIYEVMTDRLKQTY
jgi:hypothetical protein